MTRSSQIVEVWEQRFLTAQEAAEYLGISANSFRRMWRSRAVPAHFITPLRPKFMKSDLDDWASSQRVIYGDPPHSDIRETDPPQLSVRLRK